ADEADDEDESDSSGGEADAAARSDDHDDGDQDHDLDDDGGEDTDGDEEASMNADATGADSGTSGDGGGARDDGARPRLAAVLATAGRSLQSLTGRTVDAISGVEATDDGYRITMELVEVSRIPPTTDILGSYEVETDRQGEVLAFSQTARYYRNAQRSEE
ncbi:MAG TPA: gas vesicle protein GvpO, partial [Egibacteraceae bacterium]